MLTPPAAAALQKVGTADLQLNPCCFLDAPELRCLPFTGRFAEPENIAWVLDEPSNAILPFWISQETKLRLSKFQAGAPVPQDLSPELVKALRFAGVFVSPGHAASARQQHADALMQHAAFFDRHRYVPIADLLHPFHVAVLRKYVRERMTLGLFQEGEANYEHCDLIHNDPVARFFHHQLTTRISQIVGEPIQPSYAYIIRYRSGAELSRHTDRAQCEFTISLCLDFVPEPKDVAPWPISVETPDSTVVVKQSLGDSLLFCGRELPHYRAKLGENKQSTALLFHFVSRDFKGSLD